ncbi:gp24.3 conserved hypothetical protein [Escherichia phage T4]|uniref:Uncharacterized 6.6 kDa protein in Gp24-hoc intergenic region n=1 Tax=Enterobacteria phage T4 TaxID=10665 RepID=Y10C_BPT4|nr:gp24.3 conserved hypothetical protein [Escherichia phage T4]P39492.1 RecName: Full=Uncharacterized 6.6 kDa protein in Gp24-hoc intergenic region [Tequatrovirus T4]AAD42432.1 gp24.3 conserved hypothetical protein [Escherichia phage T4]
MRTEVVVFTLHESGKSFIEIARELNLQAKEVAVLWAREKVVYRKRHINKKVKNGTV